MISLFVLFFRTELAGFFYKGPGGKYLRLHLPNGLHNNYSTLMLLHESRYRHYLNQWTWLWFHRNLFQNQGVGRFWPVNYSLVNSAWENTHTGDIRDIGLIPGLGRPLEEVMATHSSILARRIPWTEKPDGLPSLGSQSWTQLKRLGMHARNVAVRCGRGGNVH